MIRGWLTTERLSLLGTAALVGALVVAAVPLPAGVRESVAPVVGETTVFAAALLAAVAVGRATVADSGPPDPEPERDAVRLDSRADGDATEPRPPGEDLQRALERIATASTARRRERKRVRHSLHELAVAVVADSEGIPRSAAAERVADGTWTDRRRAAVLLGEDVRPLGPTVRLLDWASGRPFERQVTAAVVEIADRAGAETEVSAP